MASGTSKVLQLTGCHADPNSARLGRAGFVEQALTATSASTHSKRCKKGMGSRFMWKFFMARENHNTLISAVDLTQQGK
jgi:hypothetical protein